MQIFPGGLFNSQKLLLALCLLLATAALWLTPKLASKAAQNRAFAPIVTHPSGLTSLVLYDGPVSSGDGLITARYVANLLGHFGIRPEIKPMADYRPGLAGSFSAAFVCGLVTGTIVPNSLLADLVHSDRPVCWINRHIGQLTTLPNAAARLGFKFIDYLDDGQYSTVTYAGIALPKTDGEINTVHITDRARVQVLATADDGDGAIPYAIRSEQFWYFADSIFSYNTESDRSLVFGDLLHEILGQRHPAERRALVRIEDVSADSDPADLRRVADQLFARRIPFQVALIPIYRDPAQRVELYLSDRSKVVEALRYMVARGGSIVLHGVTHQLHGVSADDFEFWDTLTARATPDSSRAALARKLEAGLEESFRVGLYPVTWETPHYTASLNHYRALAAVFSHVYERRMVTDENGTQQYFPYQVEDWMGQSVIPENLGYVNGDNPEPERLVEAAGRLRAVRDPIASFFFHPYLSSHYLESTIDGIERQGYHFVSVTQFGCAVRLGEYVVATSPRSIEVTAAHPFLHRTTVDGSGHSSEKFEKVEPSHALKQDLQPPAGGLIALQGDTRPAIQPPQFGMIDRAVAWWTGNDPRLLPPARIRTRRALLLYPLTIESAEDQRDLSSFESFLTIYGTPFARITPSRLERRQRDDGEASDHLSDDCVLFVPRCAARELSVPALKTLADWIERGGRAVLEGRSDLAQRLGFSFNGRRASVSSARDLLFPDVEINWSRVAEMERFEPPPVSANLIEDRNSQLPIGVVSRVGEGFVIYLAADFDPQTGLGYARYPYLFQHLAQRFGAVSAVTASGAEFYFDPGFREQAPIERLVASWHRDGIRAIYAAAWHFYPKWSYDYDRLIRLCHERGIAVYAWLELPQVSEKFWDEHPEWREKTATGLDGKVGWRRMMNLANDNCRAATLDFISGLIAAHDWDGVNIAELCFDTSDGLRDAAGYVPMNEDVRARFEAESGFDPRLLFDSRSPYYWQKNAMAEARWSAFRSRLLRDWLTTVLERVGKFKVHRQLDVICTVLDSLHSPRVIEKTGANARDAIELMDHFAFTLQVEDPAEAWGNSPVRYREFGETYRKLVRDPSRLMFDINVVPDRSHDIAPTDLLSGTELALAASAAAAAGNGRVALYSESSLLPEDRATLPVVLGSSVRVSGLTNGGTAPPDSALPVRIVTTKTVRLSLLSEPSGLLPVLDGELWQCGTNGQVILPAGEHHLGGTLRHPSWTDRLLTSRVAPGRLKDITAEIGSVANRQLGVAIDYSSPRRAWATVAREPRGVYIDGRAVSHPLISHGGGEWVVELPAGNHRVEIDDETIASVCVNIASALSSQSIVWLGVRFVALLTALYLGVRLRRLWICITGYWVRAEKRKIRLPAEVRLGWYGVRSGAGHHEPKPVRSKVSDCIPL